MILNETEPLFYTLSKNEYSTDFFGSRCRRDRGESNRKLMNNELAEIFIMLCINRHFLLPSLSTVFLGTTDMGIESPSKFFTHI